MSESIRPTIMITHHRTIKVDGIDIFYREAGPADAPVIVLLHGFPTSSHMYRNLIPALAELMAAEEARRGVMLSLVASVAGFRGLPQSLAYDPTKAALINLAETLYLDLQPRKIGMSVVNPGFVETPLTAHNDFRMPALITPEEAAAHMVEGWERGEFEIHFPKRFTLWLKALSHVGDALYFKAIRRATGL